MVNLADRHSRLLVGLCSNSKLWSNVSAFNSKLPLPQAGLHQDAAKLAVSVDSQEQSLNLQIAIKYEQNDLAGQHNFCCTTCKSAIFLFTCAC